MLGENQIKRLLKHCEKIDNQWNKEYKDNVPMNTELAKERHRNEGWTQALRLVLEKSTHPINDSNLDDEECLSNCCGSTFCTPGWPDCDICSDCGEHADCEVNND